MYIQNLSFTFNIFVIKLKRMKTLIIPLTILLFFSACVEKPERNAEVQLVEKAEPKDKVEKTKRRYYSIPSPEQMFSFINDNGLSFNKSLILDPSLSSQYNDPTKKAIVFGIYTADLAYAAAYQDVEGSMKLYRVVRELSQELEIQELVSPEMMSNLQANMENPDSLALIAGESYYNAVEHLENNGQVGKLALMALGGWIESMHITLNSMEKVDLGSAMVSRVAEQKITFNNLYSYLQSHKNEIGVEQELERVQRIKAVFDGLEQVKSTSTKKKIGGKLIFGKGNKIQITIEQFLELQATVKIYRVNTVGQNS